MTTQQTEQKQQYQQYSQDISDIENKLKEVQLARSTANNASKKASNNLVQLLQNVKTGLIEQQAGTTISARASTKTDLTGQRHQQRQQQNHLLFVCEERLRVLNNERYIYEKEIKRISHAEQQVTKQINQLKT